MQRKRSFAPAPRVSLPAASFSGWIRTLSSGCIPILRSAQKLPAESFKPYFTRIGLLSQGQTSVRSQMLPMM